MRAKTEVSFDVNSFLTLSTLSSLTLSTRICNEKKIFICFKLFFSKPWYHSKK